MSYLDFFSFARGIQDGYSRNNYPVLVPTDLNPTNSIYSKALDRLCSSFDIERDIMARLSRGEIDRWEAIEALENELGFSYDAAVRKVSGSIKSSTRSIFNAKEMVSAGVWISPSGDVFGVPLTHIRSVVDNPERFGLSVSQVKGVFNKHGEGVGSEGDARDEIISLLVSNGWTRIRYHPGDFGFHVELNRLDSSHKDFISAWASKVLDRNPERAGFKVGVCESLANNLETTFKLQDLIDSREFIESSGLKLYDRQIVLSALEVVDADAYWISPSGQIRPVVESHIDDIVNNPEDFNLTEKYVLDVYAKYGEPIRTEKHARDEILNGLFKNGWVRVRFYPGISFYSIEVGAFTNRTKEYLFEWASKTIEKDPGKKYCKVGVVAHLTGDRLDSTLLGLTEDALLSSKELLSFVSDYLIPISSNASFKDLAPVFSFQRRLESLQSSKKRKRSKYNGALVNNTFDSPQTGVSTVVVPGAGGVGSAISAGVELRAHPSVRYLVVSNMVHFSKRSLIASSLSGSLDTFLYQNYMAGFGDRNPTSFGSDIKDVGDNGRVVLRFDTNSGHSTEVDLGGSLETGYVVESISDELGLFPAGTVEGDLLDRDVVKEIVRSQGERDRQARIDASDPPELDGEFVGSSFVYSSAQSEDAFWISPKGEVLSVHGNHIDEIQKWPEKFGLGEDYVGQSDDVLLDGALRNGWVRIRFYKDYECTYFVDLWELSSLVRKYLWEWASAVNKWAFQVIIREKESGVKWEYSLKELVGGALFNGVGLVRIPRGLIWVKSVYDLK